MFEIKTETRKYTIKDEKGEIYFDACLMALLLMQKKPEGQQQEKAKIPSWWKDKEKPQENPAENLEKVPETEGVRLKAFKGFVHIECDHCGEYTSTCLKGWQRYFNCPKCGQRTALTEDNMRKVQIHCECGRSAFYHTNRFDGMFDIDCIECGAPVTVEWNSKKKEYHSI